MKSSHSSSSPTIVLSSASTSISTSSAISIQSIALFVNGAARAAILPYAPILVYQISQQQHNQQHHIYDNTDVAPLLWPDLALRVAILTALCSFAHSIGSNLRHLVYYNHTHGSFSISDDTIFGAVIGFIVVFLAYSTGANSYKELLLWRSLASLAAGVVLCTPRAFASGRTENGNQNNNESYTGVGGYHNIYKLYEHVPITWVLGFASTVLLGGLLFDSLRENSLFRLVSTGNFTYSVGLMVLCVSCGSILVPKWCICSSYNKGDIQDEHLLSRQHHLKLSDASLVDNDTYDIEAGLGAMNSNGSSGIRRRSCSHTYVTSPRARMESNFSEMSEYFDCASMAEESDDLQSRSNINQNYHSNTSNAKDMAQRSEIVQYVNNQCVYSNGTPAPIPSGYTQDSVPQEYLDFCRMNKTKAHQMWMETQRWRMEKNIWKIHSMPHKHFDTVKEAYTHMIHGVTQQGYPIIYEFPGKMKLKAAFQGKLTIDDMYHHYAYQWEYVLNCACESSTVKEMRKKHGLCDLSFERGAVVVMDLTGFSMSHLSSLVIQYLKGAGEIGSAHYPLVLKKAVIINAPFWISGAWSAVKVVLPESVQESTVILSSKYMSSLREFIDDDQIPKEFGGSSQYAMDKHPFETNLCDIVKSHQNGYVSIDIDVSKNFITNDREPPKLPLLTQSSLGEIDDRKYSFDHVDQKWVLDDEVSCLKEIDDEQSMRPAVSLTLNSGKWSTEITTVNSSSRKNRTNTIESALESYDFSETQPLHLDTTDLEGHFSEIVNTPVTSNLSKGFTKDKVPNNILLIVSIMYGTFCAVQGSIEVALPLWMLAPPILGGLGYDTRKSGVSIFCASMVLIFFLRSKVAQGLSHLPTKAPLRAFRVGVGTQVALLIILAVVPPIVTTVTKNESMLVLTSTVIVVSGMALAVPLGRAGAAVLHRISTASYAKDSFDHSAFVKYCKNGSFTGMLGIVGEMIGALFTALLFGWSTSVHRPFPFDGACTFCLAALVCAFVYTLSLSLFVNVVGSFSDSQKQDERINATYRSQTSIELNHHRMPSRCNLVGELFAVPIDDMASLIEDAKWSLSSDVTQIRKGV